MLRNISLEGLRDVDIDITSMDIEVDNLMENLDQNERKEILQWLNDYDRGECLEFLQAVDQDNFDLLALFKNDLQEEVDELKRQIAELELARESEG